MISPDFLIFDGHNDVLSKIFNEGGTVRAASFLEGREGAIDLANPAFLEVFFLRLLAVPFVLAFRNTAQRLIRYQDF